MVKHIRLSLAAVKPFCAWTHGSATRHFWARVSCGKIQRAGKYQTSHGMARRETRSDKAGNNNSLYFVGKSQIVGHIKVGGNSIQENRLYELVLAYNNASPDPGFISILKSICNNFSGSTEFR
jgi:hypothetical protein